jgi:hypothetical protein
MLLISSQTGDGRKWVAKKVHSSCPSHACLRVVRFIWFFALLPPLFLKTRCTIITSVRFTPYEGKETLSSELSARRAREVDTKVDVMCVPTGNLYRGYPDRRVPDNRRRSVAKPVPRWWPASAGVHRVYDRHGVYLVTSSAMLCSSQREAPKTRAASSQGAAEYCGQRLEPAQ